MTSFSFPHFTQHFSAFQKHAWLLVLLFAAIVWLRVLPYGSFGDERENFVAGWFITEGLVPYKDFFFHHAPLPFFISAVALRFFEEPWLLLRGFVFALWITCGIVSYFFGHPKFRAALALTWLVYAVSAVQFHLHFFLAESLVLPPLLAICFILVSEWQKRRIFLGTVALIWVLTSWVAIWSTIVALPPFGWILIGLLCVVVFQKNSKLQIKITAPAIIFACVLHGSSLGYFWLNGALTDTWWAVIAYNTDYYFPLRLVQNSEQAQAGYIATIVSTFFSNFTTTWSVFVSASTIALQTIIGLVKMSVSTGIPSSSYWLVVWAEWIAKVLTFEVISTVLATSLIALLFVRKSFIAAAWFIIFLITLRGRDNEVFKLSLYYLPILGFSIMGFIELLRVKKYLLSTVFGVVLFGWMSLILPKYTEVQEVARPIFPGEIVETAKVLRDNSAFAAGDQVLFLGGNADYYLLTKTLPAFKYYYYHPWFHDTPVIRKDMVDFLSSNTTYPVILESEFAGSEFGFALELENQVREHYNSASGGVYLPADTK